MKTLFFDNKDEQEQVIKEIKEYFDLAVWDYPDWVEKVENGDYPYSAFNIEAVVYDDGGLVDYRIFDPYQSVTNGIYMGHTGWSNWLLESFSTLPEEYQKEVEELGYEI